MPSQHPSNPTSYGTTFSTLNFPFTRANSLRNRRPAEVVARAPRPHLTRRAPREATPTLAPFAEVPNVFHELRDEVIHHRILHREHKLSIGPRINPGDRSPGLPASVRESEKPIEFATRLV